MAVLLLSNAPVRAQKREILINSSADLAGFDTKRLERLDEAMNDWANKQYMNGGVALIAKDGRIAWFKAVGYNDIQKKEKLQSDGIFRIASQTKAVTSVAIMMLYEEGKILLTDPVSKYIPSFSKPTVLDKFNAADSTYSTVPAKREITIKDLLTHTSGLGYAQIGSKEANAIYAKNKITAGLGVKDDNLLAAMTRLGKLPLMHQPGLRFTYGLNVDVLGCIVEIVSGTTLSDFFQTRIFKPLGMKDTYFTLPEEKVSRLVNLYSEDAQGKLVSGSNNLLNGPTAANYPLLKSTYYSGGAGLSSTIFDYAIFLQMLLNEGDYNGAKLLSRSSIRMMTMNQIADVNVGDNKFGLGFEIETVEGSTKTPSNVGTYSWGGAFSTSYWVDPKERIVLLFYRQLQNSSHGDVVEKFKALTYQALKN
ncbi:MAG: class beta-lactamase-related serine hydrolase [Pedobacter sp.]|nr:class beta-lactamase-related serine hydrolase [Pedobacter sp.]